MSALGHEQTSHHVRVTSVIPLKADIHPRRLHVRYVPLADKPHIKRGRSTRRERPHAKDRSTLMKGERPLHCLAQPSTGRWPSGE
jgi:hypothetical protein